MAKAGKLKIEWPSLPGDANENEERGAPAAGGKGKGGKGAAARSGGKPAGGRGAAAVADEDDDEHDDDDTPPTRGSGTPSKPRRQEQRRRFSADEQEQNLHDTDPDVIEDVVSRMMGSPEFAEAMQERMLAIYDHFGVGPAERRHLRFPEAGGGGNGEYRLTMRDLTDRKPWTGLSEPAKAARSDCAGGWLKAVLFGRGSPLYDRELDDVKRVLKKHTGMEFPDDICRALSIEDAEAGGNLVPPGFIPELLKDVPRQSQLYNKVRQVPVSTPTGRLPITGAAARVFWNDEWEALTRGEPSFGKIEWNIRRCGAFAEMSRELISDSNPDIVVTVGEMFSEALALENDNVIAIGDGTTQPLGLYSATGITEVELTNLDYDALVKIKHSVNIRYHGLPTFCWLFNQNVLAAILMIKDDQGNPILVEARGAEPAKILNVPFAVVNSLPNSYVGIGDMRYYLWFDRRTLTVEKSTEAGNLFYTHGMAIKLVTRVDGRVAIPPTKPFARCRTFATYGADSLAMPDLGNADFS